MNNNELPPMEQPDTSIDNAAVEKREGEKKEGTMQAEGGQEKKIDPEKGKQEYADARLEWARLEAEYNGLSEKQNGFADAVIANKEDTGVLLDLKTAGLKLNEIRDERDRAGGKSTELFFKLLEAEGGAKNTEEAETLFEEGLTKFIKENPYLAGHLVEGGSEIPGYAESAERIKRLTEKVNELAEMQIEFNALMMEMNGLNLEMARLKAEKEAKEAEQKELAKDSERNVGKLKQNILDRQGIAKQMGEAAKSMDELTGKFEELTVRVREMFKE